ncbi:SCO family protein [Aeromonas taiwanensis]|uniref:SCO family protein n=1 Tax=Aeromonas taiwanensis TaxID=633417 RepID=UPI00207D5490|nr:SCO family protein [Aeromonas taiwanensis]MCO4203278.1 SCO family protein [Aeromonas taiwanensis]
MNLDGYNSNLRRQLILGLGAVGTMASLPLIAVTQSKTTKVPYLGPSKIPNVSLLTHEGREVKFYDDIVKNKILVMNMMYVDCVSSCPLATSNLIQVQRLISKKMQGAPVQMCSLTIMPEQDTVSHLSHYVRQHNIPSGWLFMTGEPESVDLVRYRLGFYNTDPAIDGIVATHTGMLRIGNDKISRWGMMPTQAKPDQIVKMIEHVARWPTV